MGRYNNTNLFNLGLTNTETEKEKEQSFRIERLSIDSIIPNKRNEYSIKGIEELKFSILHNGLKQNLEVMDNGDGTYSLLSGERRYTALKGLVQDGNNQFRLVPCLVTDVSKSSHFLDENGNEILSDDDKEMLSILTTNSEGRQFTDADRAFQIRELKKIYTKLADNGIKLPGKMSQLIADDLQMSETNVKRINYIETHGTNELKEKFQNNEISIRAADSVAHLSTAQQREILQNSNVTSATVKNHTEKKEKKKVQRKNASVFKENKKVILQKSEIFMKHIESIKEDSDILNLDWNIEFDKDDFDILLIHIKKLSRVLNEIKQLVNENLEA